MNNSHISANPPGIPVKLDNMLFPVDSTSIPGPLLTETGNIPDNPIRLMQRTQIVITILSSAQF